MDPATETVMGSVPVARATDIDDAIQAARSGFDRWKRVNPWERSAILRRVAALLRQWADPMAEILTAEQGKPQREARSEILGASDQFDWYADEARRVYGRMTRGREAPTRLMMLKEPIGPVAAFSSWNFPALLPSRKIAPALAAGCSVVVTPAIEAPFTTILIVEACRRAGVDPEALSCLTGEAPVISAKLLSSGVIRKVSLTGSIPVGREVLRAAADGIVASTMELGGHAPVLVFADADVEAAASTCAQSKFRNAGQVCASPSRFFVQESAVDRFTARFVQDTESLRVGDGRDERTDVGPLINERRLQAAQELVSDAVSRGAEILTGGGRDDSKSAGYYFQPTVLGKVDPQSKVMWEEPFAPVAPISSFASAEQAIELANATNFGLASYLFTTDLSTAMSVAEELEAGMVGINTAVIATAEAPFGGIGQSGFGREGGAEGIEEYLNVKYISVVQ